jgi:hypothetical protein
MAKKRNPERKTYEIPVAGALAGLGRSASYDAAARGEMPTIQIGRRKVVPKELWDDVLAGRRTLNSNS